MTMKLGRFVSALARRGEANNATVTSKMKMGFILSPWAVILNHYRFSGNRQFIHAVRAGLDPHFGVPRKLFREEVNLGIDSVIPLDHFAGVSRHASEDRGHGAVRPVFGFVVRFVGAD